MYAAALLSDEADLAYASATDVAAAIRARRISPVEAVEAAARRIEARDPTLNAFVFLAIDEALEQARAAEKALMSGEAHRPAARRPDRDEGPLRLQARDGRRRSAASRRSRASRRTPLLVGRAHGGGRGDRAGQDEQPGLRLQRRCDNRLFGPTGNPFAPARNSGGSSGGGAAAVADGMVAFAEATDGGGSARIPAAWCGIVGFKQSLGRVPLVMRPNQFGHAPFMFEGPWPGRSRTSRSG